MAASSFTLQLPTSTHRFFYLSAVPDIFELPAAQISPNISLALTSSWGSLLSPLPEIEYISCPYHLGYFSSCQPVLKGGIFGPHESGNRFLFTGSGYLFWTGDVESKNHFLQNKTKSRPKSPLQNRKTTRQAGKTREKIRQTIKIKDSAGKQNPWSKPVLVPGFSTKTSASDVFSFAAFLISPEILLAVTFPLMFFYYQRPTSA